MRKILASSLAAGALALAVTAPAAAGKNTIVYAWGSLEDDTLALATQSLDVHSGTPTAVQAGTQGFADTDSTSGGHLHRGARSSATRSAVPIDHRLMWSQYGNPSRGHPSLMATWKLVYVPWQQIGIAMVLHRLKVRETRCL